MARRLRQVVDLYVIGKVAVLKDGTPLWMQALNPFEQDTARNEAQIAKARLVLALKEHGSDEEAKVRMYFFEEGEDAARRKVIDSKVADAMPRILERLRNDPEWSEKVSILERGLDDTATPAEPAEQALIESLTNEYAVELSSRFTSERDFFEDQFATATPEDLWEQYLEWYQTKRAGDLMFAEFRLHQLLFGARICHGLLVDGVWDHAACGGHAEHFFLEKAEVRAAPEDLVDLLMATADDVEMLGREAKNSHRQGSSFDSSLLPSEAAESTASTPGETPPAPPGSSSTPSPTP